MKGTIKKIYDRGEISNYTYSVCIVNKIKTFKELQLHYLKNEGFNNLEYSNEKSNAELIEIYNRYRDEDVDMEYEMNQAVSKTKSEPKLEDIVTDLDEVIKVTPTINTVINNTNTTNAYLKELEQKLEDYWNEKGDK